MDIIENFVRRFARRTIQSGQVVIITDGDALFQAAFTHLGWSDPYPDPLLLPKPAPTPHVERKATVEAPEKAVFPKPKGRIFG